MKPLIRAELLKLTTTRMFYGNVLAALAFVPISVATAILTAGEDGGPPPLETTEGLRNVFAAASSGAIIVLVTGVLVMAGEFRHGMATSTFLVCPDRSKVVRAKLVATTLVGAAIAVVASALTLAIALPWLASRDIHVAILSGDVAFVLAGCVIATALYALVGVGVGSLIRNQTAAVVATMVWVMLVESLLVSFLPAVGRWLPGGANAAASGVATVNGDLLPMWAGILLFTAYGLAFAAAGSRFVVQRDIA
jgi:ABC-2 type transport system permease protein